MMHGHMNVKFAQHYSLLLYLPGHSFLVQELGGLCSQSAGSGEDGTLSIAGIKPWLHRSLAWCFTELSYLLYVNISKCHKNVLHMLSCYF